MQHRYKNEDNEKSNVNTTESPALWRSEVYCNFWVCAKPDAPAFGNAQRLVIFNNHNFRKRFKILRGGRKQTRLDTKGLVEHLNTF